MTVGLWDRRFLDMARLVASWSKDPSTQVGAVIVDGYRRVVSIGFNGPPVDTSDDPFPRDERLARTLHAEENAILFARRDLRGCTLYVTHPCCAHCAAVIVQSGIGVVVRPPSEAAFLNRWREQIRIANNLFAEAGVTEILHLEKES